MPTTQPDLDPPEVSMAPPPATVSPFTADELEEFRRLLVQRRHRLAAEIGQLERTSLGNSGSSGNGSAFAIQLPGTSDEIWQQLLVQGAIDNKRSLLREIDQALDRIEKRTYGTCVNGHGGLLPASLLQVFPWAKHCGACSSRGFSSANA